MSDRSIALKGGFWMSISTAVTMLSQFLRLIILTRFLDKGDFGIVSIINLVIGLCLTFTDLGFATSIMYKRDISDREFSTLFWIQFILFTLIYVVLVFVSPLVSAFYKESILATLIPLAGLSILFQAIGKLYDSVLQKQYKFRLLALLAIFTNIVSLIIAWVLASKGYGVYSLILSTLFQVGFLNIGLFILGFKLQKVVLRFNFKEAVPLVKIGFYQTGTKISDFLSYKVDVMIIGKLLGVEILGVYDLAKELVVRFVSFISTIVSKVALPILVNNNASDEMVKQRFLQVTKAVAMISIPVCIALAVFSKEAVLILYGEKYAEASSIVAVFAFVSIISSISCFIDMLGVSKGRTDLNFKNTVFRILITTPIVIVSSLVSINAVALGQLLASIICFFVFWNIVAKRTYPIPLSLYFAQFAKYFFVVLIVGVLTFAIKSLNLMTISDNVIICSLLYGFVFLLFYYIGARLFLKEEIFFMKSFIPKKSGI